MFQKTRRSEKVKQSRFQDRCRVPKEGVFAAFGLAVGSRREVGGQARRGVWAVGQALLVATRKPIQSFSVQAGLEAVFLAVTDW